VGTKVGKFLTGEFRLHNHSFSLWGFSSCSCRKSEIAAAEVAGKEQERERGREREKESSNDSYLSLCIFWWLVVYV